MGSSIYGYNGNTLTMVNSSGATSYAWDFENLERIEKGDSTRANYYQAIELLHGVQAVPVLRRQFEESRSQLASRLQRADKIAVCSEYLQCAKTLFALTRDGSFLSALQQAQDSVPPEIRTYAERLLSEAEKAD